MNCHSFFNSFESLDPVEVERGIRVSSLLIHGHEARRIDIDPETRIPPHRHPADVLTLVLEGRLQMTVGSETKIIGPGELFLVPAFTDHEGKALQDKVRAVSFSRAIGEGESP